MIEQVYDIFGIPCVFRDCLECRGPVLVRMTPDGPDPAPESCSQHGGNQTSPTPDAEP